MRLFLLNAQRRLGQGRGCYTTSSDSFTTSAEKAEEGGAKGEIGILVIPQEV